MYGKHDKYYNGLDGEEKKDFLLWGATNFGECSMNNISTLVFFFRLTYILIYPYNFVLSINKDNIFLLYPFG